MAPPHLLLTDSSAKALIPQHISSSSPISSTDSPTEPSLPASSPPQHPVHICNPQLDLSILSSSSSSFSLVPEIIPVPGNNGPWQRQKKQQHHGHKRHYNRDGKTDHAGEKRSKLVRSHTPRAAFACQGNACCKCVAGFTADCAAICCCPLALLHLAALTFIRLPTAVAWKMLVKLKNRICTKKLPTTKDGQEDSPRPKITTPPWPYGGSPEAGTTDPAVQVMRFDSQKLSQLFETGNLEFGGLSTKREPF